MKKTYQIYASSDNGYGSDVAEQEYKFDWGIIPEGEYEMTWSLISKARKTGTAAGLIESIPTIVSFDVPFMTDRYEVAKLSGYAGSSNIAGFLNYYDGPITGGFHMRQFRVLNSDNAPVIVRGKPSGNKFIVRCLNELTLGVMLDYTLVVTFKSLC
tara:strand:- start:1380 stop:1847 length:468 start_codon:yes stop_codon:yes gene_type:complete